MKYIPLRDQVVIRVAEPDKKIDQQFSGTKHTIYLPEQAQSKQTKGGVLSVGPGKHLESGAVLSSGLKVGDTVLFTKYGGVEVEDGIVIVAEENILAKVVK